LISSVGRSTFSAVDEDFGISDFGIVIMIGSNRGLGEEEGGGRGVSFFVSMFAGILETSATVCSLGVAEAVGIGTGVASLLATAGSICISGAGVGTVRGVGSGVGDAVVCAGDVVEDSVGCDVFGEGLGVASGDGVAVIFVSGTGASCFSTMVGVRVVSGVADGVAAGVI
jgi:hypothetical protein